MRIIFSIVSVLLLATLACGGGDKSEAPEKSSAATSKPAEQPKPVKVKPKPPKQFEVEGVPNIEPWIVEGGPYLASVALNNEGMGHYKKKRYDKAIEYFTSAIRQDVRNPVYFNNRAMCWNSTPVAFLILSKFFVYRVACFDNRAMCGNSTHPAWISLDRAMY